MTTATPDAARLPALFVSHGSPMFVFEAGSTGPALRAFGDALPRPRGIVMMSPHWMARTPTVMTNPAPQTWHDFGGFPAPLYELQYPAAGSPELGQQVIDLLAQAGIAAQPDAKRPLDHGTWVPMMHMFPKADVPIVQIALPANAGPREVYALGAALASLRDQGILLMGSGSMTHNLAEFFGGEREAAPYVVAFSRWIEDKIIAGDLPALLDYRVQAPHAHRAHPTEDHFLPLFFALGAGGSGARVDYLSREVMYGMLAMDTITLQ